MVMEPIRAQMPITPFTSSLGWLRHARRGGALSIRKNTVWRFIYITVHYGNVRICRTFWTVL